jgi:hypothetical protein
MPFQFYSSDVGFQTHFHVALFGLARQRKPHERKEGPGREARHEESHARIHRLCSNPGKGRPNVEYTLTSILIQLRWCLSGSDDWRLVDRKWMPEEFYGAVLLAFGINVTSNESEDDSEDEEQDVWVTETLNWWNGYVFHLM